MKTKNNIQETVNDQVKRMVLRGSAVILSLALITLTLNAQDLWKQFSNTSSYGKMALLMTGQSSETEKTDAVFELIDAEVSSRLNNSSATFICEPEREEEMELESWMTDEAHFNFFNNVETEEALRVEDWMIDNTNFNTQLVSESVDFEKPLEIEPWMTLEEYFNSAESLTAEESALKIENWMLDNKNFCSNLVVKETNENEPMQLEAWMTDNHKWGF